jgi:anthranilate synthase component 1
MTKLPHNLPNSLPTWDAFLAAAKDANVLSLCVPLNFDHETAVTLADRFVQEPQLFFLESATTGPGNMARYSFLGFDPEWTWQWRCTDKKKEQNPFTALRQRLKNIRQKSLYGADVRLGGPDVAAYVGACGFFGYDAATALEPTIGKPPPKKLGLPDAFFFFPRSFLVLDHLARRLFVCRNVTISNAGGREVWRSLYEEGCQSLLELTSKLLLPHATPVLNIKDAPPDFAACEASFPEATFKKAAAQCLEEIRSGEIFQVQIGNRLSLKTAARPFDIFRHLRVLNPSPYMFFYKFGDEHLLGASPEMMVGVEAGRVTHRPIAGTRRRSWDTSPGGRDERMRIELQTSEKERAEHVMLVDLARNDVGRVAAAGSVKVDELMSVEEYSHVFHMVSQVTGELAPGKDAFDALISGFPNGTVSGAPKIRAMQLIYELEKVSREFYAGSLGLFDCHGNLRSTILIRSIHVARGVASTHASAGIVYDSVDSEEWLETRNKMAATVIAMQNTV